MHKITAYKFGERPATISPLSAKRDWMDLTWDKHAYNCFPITLTNSLGWAISFPEEISFIWDGIDDSSPDRIRFLKGGKYCFPGRGHATVTFHTGISFKTEENISLLHMPVPNLFVDGAQAFTTLISTSFFDGEFPSVWKITKPNVPITIKANQPVAAIIPISLGELNNSEINFEPLVSKKDSNFNAEYIAEMNKIHSQQKWTNWYRNATDHKGNIIGKHELKSIRLKVNE